MVSRRVAQRVAADIDVPVDTVAAIVGALHDVLQVATDESGIARLRTLGQEGRRRAMQAVAEEVAVPVDTVSRVLGQFIGEAASAGRARDVLAMEDPVEGGGAGGGP